jgi:hypothetical protein
MSVPNGAKLSDVASFVNFLECGGSTPLSRDRPALSPSNGLDGRGVSRPISVDFERSSASSRTGEKRRRAAALLKLFGPVIALKGS